MRHVPPSGANVSPVRRTFWICAAVPTVKASTRSEGRLTETRPASLGSSMMSRTVSSMPEKSALDSDVSATSSWPLHSRPRCTISRTCAAGRSRTGRVIMPAWQNRQPARAAAEHLDVEPVVHHLGQRHQRACDG